MGSSVYLFPVPEWGWAREGRRPRERGITEKRELDRGKGKEGEKGKGDSVLVSFCCGDEHHE